MATIGVLKTSSVRRLEKLEYLGEQAMARTAQWTRRATNSKEERMLETIGQVHHVVEILSEWHHRNPQGGEIFQKVK